MILPKCRKILIDLRYNESYDNKICALGIERGVRKSVIAGVCFSQMSVMVPGIQQLSVLVGCP